MHVSNRVYVYFFIKLETSTRGTKSKNIALEKATNVETFVRNFDISSNTTVQYFLEPLLQLSRAYREIFTFDRIDFARVLLQVNGNRSGYKLELDSAGV